MSRRSILTPANLLTCLRLLLTVPFLYLIHSGRFGAALVIFTLASISDYADGYIARRLDQISSLGRVLDPLADKVLTTAAFIVMAIPRAEFPSIPVWLAVSVVTRDFLILLGALIIYISAGHKDFRPTTAGKVNTALEMLLIIAFLVFHSIGRLTWALPPLYYIVFISVVVSGLIYLTRGLSLARTSLRGKG